MSLDGSEGITAAAAKLWSLRRSEVDGLRTRLARMLFRRQLVISGVISATRAAKLSDTNDNDMYLRQLCSRTLLAGHGLERLKRLSLLCSDDLATQLSAPVRGLHLSPVFRTADSVNTAMHHLQVSGEHSMDSVSAAIRSLRVSHDQSSMNDVSAVIRHLRLSSDYSRHSVCAAIHSLHLSPDLSLNNASTALSLLHISPDCGTDSASVDNC